MGSYNASCAITGIPLKNQALLLIWSEDKSRISEGMPNFYGKPVRAKYFDYGDFDLLEENPFDTWLKPNIEGMQGFLRHWTDENTGNAKQLAGGYTLGINLWATATELLHFYHDLILIRPKWALREIQSAHGIKCNSILDVEGSNTTKSVIKDSNPAAWTTYVAIMDKCPLSYDNRATKVHELLNELSYGERMCRMICESRESEDLIIQELADKFFCADVPGGLEEVKTLIRKKLCCRLNVSAVYPEAFAFMVNCVKNQLGDHKIKALMANEFADPSPVSSDLTEALQSEDSAAFKIIKRMLVRETRELATKKIKRAMGNIPFEEAQAGDLVLFEENFNHGFKFSSMTEYRQYEGVAHIEAQARAVLAVLNSEKTSFYKSGNWETFRYK